MKNGVLSIVAIACLGVGLLIIVALMLTAPVHATQVALDGHGGQPLVQDGAPR